MMDATLLITALLGIVSTGIIMLVLLYQKRQVQYLREKEGMQQKFEKEMLESRLEIKEQTFKEVSQELHDNVAQMLTLAKLNLMTLDISLVEPTTKKLENAKEYLTNAIQDIRDLSKTMNTDFFADVGLVDSIKDQLRKLDRGGTIATKFEEVGEVTEIEPKKGIILLRIVQEAIQNVVKHSDATFLTISIDSSLGNIRLTITDNGKGFDITNHTKGSGMINMSNRCKVIGADCSIESGSNLIGTCVTITMACRKANSYTIEPGRHELVDFN